MRGEKDAPEIILTEVEWPLGPEKRSRQCSEKIPKELEHEYTVWEGTTPFLEILKYAREKDVELILMGSHTREKNKKWYIGSAVEQVSARSICPVAVVTNPKALLHAESKF